MTDCGRLYRDHLAALSRLAPTLTEGRMDGAPGPERTARHVSERARLPVAALPAGSTP